MLADIVESDLWGISSTFLKREKCSIDNILFSLHTKYTVAILFVCAIIILTGTYIFDPINCVSDSAVDDVIDTYCWITSTYTLPEQLHPQRGLPAHPGVRQKEENDTPLYHKYYQWVGVVLFIQAAAFLVPRQIWKSLEGGRIKHILDLKLDALSSVDENEQENDKEKLTKYLHSHLNKHNFYAAKFFICELLNIGNLLSQMMLTNLFVGRAFTTYGFDVLKFSYTNSLERRDPLSQVFPTVAKCTFNTYGPAGGVQSFDALCVLSINVINEKIYIVLWFWLLFLLAVSILGLICRISLILGRQLRFGLLRMKIRGIEMIDFDILEKHLGVGDWFLLNQLYKNMDALIWSKILKDLARETKLKENYVSKSANNDTNTPSTSAEMLLRYPAALN